MTWWQKPWPMRCWRPIIAALTILLLPLEQTVKLELCRMEVVDSGILMMAKVKLLDFSASSRRVCCFCIGIQEEGNGFDMDKTI